MLLELIFADDKEWWLQITEVLENFSLARINGVLYIFYPIATFNQDCLTSASLDVLGRVHNCFDALKLIIIQTP